MSNVASWYIMKVHSNQEEKIVQNVQDELKRLSSDGINYQDFIYDFCIPKRHSVQIVNGKKVDVQEIIYPGYILIKMINNITKDLIGKRIYLVIKNIIAKKSGTFLSNSQFEPYKLSNAEYEKMINNIDNIQNKKSNMTFILGSKVKILSGSFTSMEGSIKAFNDSTQKITLTVPIFGCDTEVELDYTEISLINEDGK